MKLSVIIPTHNRKKFLERALDSIEKQTFKDYEVIVVFDRCTDGSENVVFNGKSIIANFGGAWSRNAGLEVATGDYILFCDDDDYYNPEAFEKIAQKCNGADEIVFGMDWKGVGYAPPILKNGAILPSVINRAYKREFIGSTRFVPTIDEDNQFNVDLNVKQPTIETIDEPLYVYDYLATDSYSSRLGRTYEGAKRYWGL